MLFSSKTQKEKKKLNKNHVKKSVFIILKFI